MTLKTRPMVTTTTFAAALLLGASAASAGGFAVREQGALGQGASFAGAGASNALSSMFMNSAAVTTLSGTNADSSLAFIAPEGNLTAGAGTTASRLNGATWSNSTDIGKDAFVPAAYLSHQFKSDPRLYIGIGINSGFGLHTEPDKRWSGSEVGGSTSLFTINYNPVLGYKFSDQLSVAAGPAFEYAKGTFKFATASPTGPNTFFTGTDMAVGATAGLMYTPTQATRIGLGWRSQITHELEGRFGTSAGAPLSAGAIATFTPGVASKVDLRLPDIVNLSLQQAVAPNMRLLGTVEWTNWSRFGGLEVVARTAGNAIPLAGATNPTGAVAQGGSIAKISGAWDDGWFFSGGLEYDVNSKLTVRAGGAYEISPITKASERIVGIPDANRIWASFGLSYALNPKTSIDFGYSHVFVENAQVERDNVTKTVHLSAGLEASADIVSLGVRMKLGE
jgi:long-chain fatty acid transport protein